MKRHALLICLLFTAISLKSFGEGLENSVCQLQNLKVQSLEESGKGTSLGEAILESACTGTVVKKRLFLTAAHCVDGIPLWVKGKKPKHVSRIVCPTGNETHWVWKQHVTANPDFVQKTPFAFTKDENDQALIRTEEDFRVPVTPLVNSAEKLHAFASSALSGRVIRCIMMGFGNRMAGQPGALHARAVSTVGADLLSLLVERNALFASRKVFNLGYKFGAHPGDSGGPVFCMIGDSPVLVGSVTSILKERHPIVSLVSDPITLRFPDGQVVQSKDGKLTLRITQGTVISDQFYREIISR